MHIIYACYGGIRFFQCQCRCNVTAHTDLLKIIYSSPKHNAMPFEKNARHTYGFQLSILQLHTCTHIHIYVKENIITLQYINYSL